MGAEESPAAALAGQVTNKDPAIGLQAVVALRRLLEELERLHVDNARDQGWTWQSIARHCRSAGNPCTRSMQPDANSPARRTEVFERFTELAKRAVAASQDAALSLGHDFIGTEHLLLGLTSTAGTAGEVLREHGIELSQAREETVRLLEEAGVAATGGQEAKNALSSIGIDVAEIQRRADDTFGPGTFRFPRPPFTPRAKKVLVELTWREARALGHQHIDTEHLLLGLLTEGESVAIQVLTALEAETAALRQAVLARVTPQAS